jgi:hypothetical protein
MSASVAGAGVPNVNGRHYWRAQACHAVGMVERIRTAAHASRRAAFVEAMPVHR